MEPFLGTQHVLALFKRTLTSPVTNARSTSLTLLVVITVLGAAVRLFHLTAQDLWMDEVALIDNVRVFDQSGLTALAQADHVAPLQTLLLWLVSRVFGDGVLAMRLPSAVIGTLTIPAIYALSMRMFQARSMAIFSAALVAISPFAVWYSQEARMYALLLLCATVYVTVAWPVVTRPLRSAELVLLTVVTTVGLYTHHFMAMVPVAFGLFLMLRGGLLHGRAWAWAGTQIIGLLLFTFWLYLGASHLEPWGGSSKSEVVLWVPYTLFTFLYGFSFGPGVRDLRVLGSSIALEQHFMAVLIGTAVGAAVLIMGSQRALQSRQRDAGLFLLVWLIIPITLALIAALATNIAYNVRYVVTAFPPMVMLCSLAVDDRHFGGIRVGLISAFVACMLFSLRDDYFAPEYAKENMQPLAEMITSDHPRVLVINNFKAMPVLSYYGARLPKDTIDLDNRHIDRLADYVIQRIDALPDDARHDLWFVEYRSWESDPTNKVRRYLDSHFTVSATTQWVGAELRRYRMP